MQWDEERSTLQTKLASRTAHNELLNNALSSLQTENSTLKGSLSEAESAIEKLNSELSAAQTQLASQTAEFAASSEANAVLGKENKRLVQDVSFLAAQLQQLTDLLHKLTAPGAAGNAPRSRPSSANESSVKMQSQGTEAAPALDAALHQEVARTHAAMAQAPPAMVQEAPLAEVSLQQMDQNVVQDAGQKPWPGSAEGVKAVTGATRHPSEERPQARPKAYSHFDSAKVSTGHHAIISVICSLIA